jgi:hypothetical protein
MLADSKIIEQTEKWIRDVIIACNFCPFAAAEVKKGSVRYVVVHETELQPCLDIVLTEMQLLEEDEKIETTLLIFPEHLDAFDDFLYFHEMNEDALIENDYEGIFQLATFHPNYQFDEVPEEDPANYTNRSPYPMLHILREESIEKALDRYPDPDFIPDNNIEFARKKGLAYMQLLRDSCF